MAEKYERHITRAANNDRLRAVVDMFGGDCVKVAEGLGVSRNHVQVSIKPGADLIAKTLDVACEAIIRRHGKANTEPVVGAMIARIPPAHWPTVKEVITSMSGNIVEEFHGLVTEGLDDSADRVIVICTMKPSTKLDTVDQIIRGVGGSSKRVP